VYCCVITYTILSFNLTNLANSVGALCMDITSIKKLRNLTRRLCCLLKFVRVCSQHIAAPEVKPAVKACRDLATLCGRGWGSAGQLTQSKMYTSDTFCNTVGIAD
jgi:hypothetical protein